MEIERLHQMLLLAGIEHEWLDRTPRRYDRLVKERPDLFESRNWGWQVVLRDDEGNLIVSAIEGFGTYGYCEKDNPLWGEKPSDLIEIKGLLTPEESEHDSVVGWLTAEDVFERIRKHLERE